MREGVGDGSRLAATEHLAAAIVARTPRGNLHAGVLFRAAGDGAEALHLGWEDRLHSGWEWTGLWAVPDAEPEKLRSVAAVCRRVRTRFERDPRFPYGVMFGADGFDEDGALLVVPPARGLTCATFVLAVFQTAGVVLAVYETWPVRPDLNAEFLDTIGPICRDYPGLYETLEAEVSAGCVRFLPEEIVGACRCKVPATFEAARAAADAVLDTLPANA